MGDIYLTRLNPGRGWEAPEHLGCQGERPVVDARQYFGRAPGLPVTADIWVTTRQRLDD